MNYELKVCYSFNKNSIMSRLKLVISCWMLSSRTSPYLPLTWTKWIIKTYGTVNKVNLEFTY